MTAQLSQFALLDCFNLVFQQIEQTLNQIEQSPIQSEDAKFRSLFEQSADALMLAENGVIFDCNQAAVELFGWQDKAVLPLHAVQLSPEYQPDGRASFEKASEMIALAQRNGNHRFEWMHRHSNGEDFWTEILLTQIELDGKPIQYTTLRDISDRKQVEAKLREGERRFQAIFNQTFQLAGILSPDGILLDANQVALNVIAAQPEEVIGKPFWETAWWTHSPTVQQQLQQAIAQAKAGQIAAFEYDAPTVDGKTITLEFSIKPITDSHGEVVMLIPEAQDISDRKQAEAKRQQAENILRDQEQFLRSIYDNVENPIFVVDVLSDGDVCDFRYVGWNAATERASGLSSQDVFGRTPEEIFGAIEGAEDRQRLVRCVQEDCSLTIEEKITFSGQSTWWLTTYNPVRDRDGQIHRIVGTALSINDRKQAEADRLEAEMKLREQEQFLRSIYDNVEHLIFVVDVLPNAEVSYVGWNPVCERVIGLSSEAVFGRTPEEIFGAIEGANDRRYILQCAQENRAIQSEAAYTIQDQQTHWLTTYNPLCSQSGQVHRVVGTTFNITDRKRTEEALRQSETRFQELATNLPGMIYQFRRGAEGTQGFTYVSPGCLDLHEVSAEAFMQDNNIGLAMIHPEDKAQFVRSIALSAQTLQGLQQEYRIVTPSGKVKWLQGHSQPKQLANGDIVWDGFLTDTSDRKRAEAELEYQSNLLRTVIDSSPDWIFVKDSNFRYLLANRAVADAVGLLPEEMIGKDDLEIGLSPEEVFGDPQKGIIGFRTNDQNALAGEIVFNAGEPVTSGENSFRWVETQKLPLRDRQGRIFGVLGLCRDVTERKKTEIALRQSEQNLRTIFNNVQNAFILHEADGTIVDVNQKMLEMYGVTHEQALELSIAKDCSSPDNPLEQLPIIWERVSAGETQRFEWIARRPIDGSVFDVEVVLQKLTLSAQPVILASIQDISDRKQAEAELRKTQRQFQMLMDYAPAVIYIKDLEGKYLAISRNFCEIFSKRPEEILDQDDYQVHPPAIAEMIRSNDQAVIASRSSLTIEETVMQSTGEHSYISTKFVFKDEQGNPYALCGISFDISDRKQAEEALRQQQIQLQTILDAVPSSIWLKDTRNNVLRANAAAAAVVGLPADQIEGKSIGELLPQGVEIYYLDDLEVICSGQPKLGIIEPQYLPSGEQRWIRTDKVPYRNSAGEIVGLVAVATDITDRKRAEIALRESEQQLREQAQRERLLNQLTQQIRNSLDFDIALSTALTEIQAILGVDRCQFAWYHPHATEPYWEVIQEVCHPGLPNLTGCYPSTTVGLLATKLLRLERLCVANVETVDDPVWQAFVRSLQMRSMLVIPMQMPSGTIGAICCSHSSKSHDWGTDEIELLEAVMGQLAIALNQADLYAQSRAKAHELEQTLHQLQRTQAQMLQSEKMSSLGQLVAGVAHEINNPVNFIYGNLNYASDYIEDLLGLMKLYQQQYPQPVAAIEAQAEAIDLDFLIADLPKLLNSMKVGANRIQKIVASLRTFSRMDEAEVKSVNIHEGIDSTLLILQHRIKKRDDRTVIEIVKHYADLPPIECYAGQLNQVFMNLLSNAIDALEDALKVKADLIPTITIETKLSDRFVAIKITDNGLGIPESVQQRLFDPFFTTKPLGKGTGMGLSISYQIVVEKHHGSIDCLSSEAGTTFVVNIPIEPIS